MDEFEIDTDGVGWVVVEYNQASGRPEVVVSPCIDDTRKSAEECAVGARAAAFRTGRRERYAVARLVLEEDPS